MPVLASLLMTFAPTAHESKTTPLKDGFVRVETTEYVIEIPSGWTVGEQTPYGARDLTPNMGEGKMAVMTTPPMQTSWKEVYDTSLYFIQREEKGTPTEYRIGKAKQGYESMSFEMLDENRWANRRYVIVKRGNRYLALSLRIPNAAMESSMMIEFIRMVDTARIKPTEAAAPEPQLAPSGR